MDVDVQPRRRSTVTEPVIDPETIIRSVYVYFDGDRAIYVGVTGNLRFRLREHKRTAPWWTPDLRTVVLSNHVSTNESFAAERAAIRKYDPIANVVGRRRAA